MDFGSIVGIILFGVTLIPTVASIISAFQSKSTPFVYKPAYRLPVTVPTPPAKSVAPAPPPLSAPAPPPDPYLDMRLAIRKELEADQTRSFRANLVVNIAISGFFYVAGVLTTMVVAAH